MYTNKILQLTIWIFLLFSLFSCAQKSRPIDYNTDNCALCKMQISDPKFGAELVTDKGKVFTFDSAECMLRYYKKNKEQSFSKVLVTDFNNPNSLIDATSAAFLISENRPSPMGADLSSYATMKEAELAKQENGGEVYVFPSIIDEL